METLHLKSHRFRAEREMDWRRLERLLTRIESGKAKALTRAELLEVPVLYRQALSSLSVARAVTLDAALIEYLEGLCTRAYFVVYGARARPMERIGAFFRRDWPAAVRSLWRESLVSLLVLLAGAALGFWLVMQDPAWFSAFMSSDSAQGRTPETSAEVLRATLYTEPDGRSGMTIFATFLFTNNAQVAIYAFALGFLFCLPTAFLIFSNGASLGALAAVFAGKGLLAALSGWLLIHGVTELFAIVLAGAAGFSIGMAVLFPGERPRLEAAAMAGRRAGVVMTGVVLMLIVAGALEGFARQMVTNDIARWSVAAITLCLWTAYFYWPRRPAR